MATAPVKSPLHNFPLTFLKWGGAKNHTSGGHHRYRRPVSAENSPVADHGEVDPDRNDSEPEAGRTSKVGSRTVRNRFGFASCSSAEKVQKQQGSNESDEVVRDGKQQHRDGEEVEAEETVQKPWKLRPRKVLFSKPASIGVKNGEFQEPGGTVTGSGVGSGQNQSENQNQQQPKSLRLRGFSEQQSTEKKEKRKFWIALSREEIEEDIFLMTGSRPARRPRKRPKNVQKQLDAVFPGLWLVGVTADAYRIAEAPPKRINSLLASLFWKSSSSIGCDCQDEPVMRHNKVVSNGNSHISNAVYFIGASKGKNLCWNRKIEDMFYADMEKIERTHEAPAILG
ncbi:hypothetical protein G4B88_014624 [Cannabis sativa]|uniref:Uncharacterized protein n=2 Tax=Cannabis sativa TaxID=3483 RepID=A0A7J6IAU3_CANSA|nr:hypothetical protein G4B88_014624 [Cannabis sativa]